MNQYFINACVLAFPNIYRRWQTRTRGWQDVQLVGPPAAVENVTTTRDHADTIVAAFTLDAAIAALPNNARQSMLLRAQGYSVAEIAEMLLLLPSTVASHVHRALQSMRRLLSEAG